MKALLHHLLKIWLTSKDLKVNRVASYKRLYEDIVHKSSQMFGIVDLRKMMLEHIDQVNQVTLIDDLYHFRSLIT